MEVSELSLTPAAHAALKDWSQAVSFGPNIYVVIFSSNADREPLSLQPKANHQAPCIKNITDAI